MGDATVEVESGTAGGLATGIDTILMLFCSSAGPLNTPRYMASAKAWRTTFGFGDGTEEATHYFKRVKKKICAVRLPSTVAATIALVDKDDVAGSSVITASGTPHRKMKIVFEVLTAGTIAADGIEFRYSLNGGIDYSQKKRLGTAVSYEIPQTGVTLNFAAGTLAVGDIARVWTTSPKWDDGDFAAAIAAVIAEETSFRAMVVVGDFNKAEADTLVTEIDALYEANKRPVVFIAGRDWYDDARMTGEPADVDYDGTAHTITRGSGSFIADGFKVGMRVTSAGTATNDEDHGELTSVTATVLTFASGLTTEANLDGADIEITATETEDHWISALLSNLGPFEDEEGRVVISAGMTRMHSEIFPGDRLRVPLRVAAVERWMSHDVQISPNKVADGALEDHLITDDDNNIVEHDSRANDTLEDAGFLTARSYVSRKGAFVHEPHTRAPSGSAFRVIPWVAVANLYADVVQSATELLIGDEPELEDDGTLTAEERQRYKDFVEDQLKAELLASKREGPRASNVTWEPADDDVLNVPGAALNATGTLNTLGLIDSVHTRVVVNPPA